MQNQSIIQANFERPTKLSKPTSGATLKLNKTLEIKQTPAAQQDLFGETPEIQISIKEAAEFASVSQATIRNWIKAGNIHQAPSGLVIKNSLADFKRNEIGKKKLTARANKSSKDTHNHDDASLQIQGKINSECFDSDALSSEYESSLSDSYRNKEGIYYTPPSIVANLFDIRRDEIGSATFCDPCCGSGNFLVHAINLGFKPENIYGFDTDVNAISIAKKRIYAATGVEPKNIKCADFLSEAAKNSAPQFDFIYTNPPWGKKIQKEQKEQYGLIFGAGRALDTSALFFFACIRSLKEGGRLGLLLPDAFFNIATFEEARIRISKLGLLRIVDYGKAFKGLISKAIGISLLNIGRTEAPPIVTCESAGGKYERSSASFTKNPKTIFNYWCSPEENDVILRAYSTPHSTLAGHCNWGLGVVTGDNDKFCRPTQEDDCIPVFRGADIGKGTIAEPSCYIPSDLTLYQQVAPRPVYEAKEKIIYKFITNKLGFFHDTEQRYVLNSANILIARESLGISTSQLCDLLNSDFMDWLFLKLFSTHKVLRGDLEQLPIYVDYFRTNTIFHEDSFLEFLSIERTGNGTYRTKR